MDGWMERDEKTFLRLQELEMKESCEMENSEVRFYDVRSSKGRLPFLNKVSCCDVYFSSSCFSFVQILPDVPEPPMYWIDTDPRAEAAHMGRHCQNVLYY